MKRFILFNVIIAFILIAYMYYNTRDFVMLCSDRSERECLFVDKQKLMKCLEEFTEDSCFKFAKVFF